MEEDYDIKEAGEEYSSMVSIPFEYINAIKKGFGTTIQNGILAGYPLESLKVRLIDVAYNSEDSDELAFEICAKIAFREAALKTHPVLMEPIMDVEVVTPGSYLGDVISDLNRRRGQLEGAGIRGKSQIVNAKVPLS